VDLPMQNLFTGGFRNLKFANYYKSDCNLDYRHQPQHGSQFGGAVPVVSGELDCNNGSQWFDKDSFQLMELRIPCFLHSVSFHSPLHPSNQAGSAREALEIYEKALARLPVKAHAACCVDGLMPRQHAFKEGLNLVIPL